MNNPHRLHKYDKDDGRAAYAYKVHGRPNNGLYKIHTRGDLCEIYRRHLLYACEWLILPACTIFVRLNNS